MISLRVEWKGKKGLENLIKSIENISFVRAEAEIATVADKTVAHMQNTIQENKKRPDLGTHKLENSIDWDEVLNIPGKKLIVGIGNIDKIKSEAPYFEVLDAGGYVPPANIGYFTSGSGMSGDKTPPEAGSSGQNWVHTGKEKGSFYMKPKKAIEGIDYIEKAIRYCDKLLNSVITEIGKEFIESIKKS